MCTGECEEEEVGLNEEEEGYKAGTLQNKEVNDQLTPKITEQMKHDECHATYV